MNEVGSNEAKLRAKDSFPSLQESSDLFRHIAAQMWEHMKQEYLRQQFEEGQREQAAENEHQYSLDVQLRIQQHAHEQQGEEAHASAGA